MLCLPSPACCWCKGGGLGRTIAELGIDFEGRVNRRHDVRDIAHVGRPATGRCDGRILLRRPAEQSHRGQECEGGSRTVGGHAMIACIEWNAATVVVKWARD